jgi:hypothetical protein
MAVNCSGRWTSSSSRGLLELTESVIGDGDGDVLVLSRENGLGAWNHLLSTLSMRLKIDQHHLQKFAKNV